MTLNEWEQSNIEVLTSQKMGEWLGRRENRLLEQIRAEIADLADSDAYGDYQQGFNFGLMRAAQIIDKYKAESEN